jgi:hypothetical protein
MPRGIEHAIFRLGIIDHGEHFTERRRRRLFDQHMITRIKRLPRHGKAHRWRRA